MLAGGGRRKSFTAILAALCVVLSFQACTRDHGFQSTAPSSALRGGGGNGDGYDGKPTPYKRYDNTSLCSDLGADGKALPNDEVFYFETTDLAQIVRRNCKDIEPTMTQFTLSADRSSLTAQGIQLARSTFGSDLSIIAADCPAGMTAIAGATRTNLMLDSLDFLGPAWKPHQGIGIKLNGSMQSLPRFQIFRNDAQYPEFWRRQTQLPNLQAGVRYATTLFVERGTDTAFNLMVWQWQPTTPAAATVRVDLTTGAQTLTSDGSLGTVTHSAKPYGAGYIVTMYFTAAATQNADIGFAPVSTNLGDSINATAAQLENVATFCQ